MGFKKIGISRIRLAILLSFWGYSKNDIKRLLHMDYITPDCTYVAWRDFYWLDKFNKKLTDKLKGGK